MTSFNLQTDMTMPGGDDDRFLRTFQSAYDERKSNWGSSGRWWDNLKVSLTNDIKESADAEKASARSRHLTKKQLLDNERGDEQDKFETIASKNANNDISISDIVERIREKRAQLKELKVRAAATQQIEKNKIDKLDSNQNIHNVDMVQKSNESAHINSKIASLTAQTKALETQFVLQSDLQDEQRVLLENERVKIDGIEPILEAKKEQKVMSDKILTNFKVAEEKLEEEIEKAKENAEQTGEPLQLFMLKKLLKRKKQLLASKSDTLNRLGLFGIEESAYNLNTMLMDRKEARNLPSDILLKNQRKEVDKNIRNLTQVTKDLTTASRNVQSSDNKVRKKQFIMHLLTHTFAFTLMLILVAMLMKNNILSQSLGYKIIGFLVTAMVIVIGANYYFNSNRNVIYFEKRDFPIAEEETATPLEKCDSPIGEDKWEAEKTDSGHTYYINSRTGQTAWTIPVAEEEEKAEEEEEKAEAESATESSST